MTPFDISRLETKSGTYKIKGSYDLSGKSLNFDFESLAMMGTDGWVELNPDSKAGKRQLQAIMPDLLSHLEV